MYYKLREAGFFKRIDVNIGIEFMDIDKILKQTSIVSMTTEESDNHEETTESSVS